MITFSVLSDSAVKLTFDGNSHYLQDGEITVPKNSLALVKDESELITFIKAATGDAYLSFHIEDTNFANYTELENWYKANMVSAYGGGGGGESSGISSGEVQTMIDNSISGKADTSAVNSAVTEFTAALSGEITRAMASEEALSGAVSAVTDTLEDKVDVSELEEVEQAVAQSLNVINQSLSGKADITDLEDAEQVIAQSINVLNQNKLDVSAYTPVDLSEYYTSAQTQSAIDNVKVHYIDFGVASVRGLTDEEWDAGIAAYQAHRPIYAKLLENWYVCTDVIYNGTDTLIISASDSNSNYKYTVVKEGSNQYSISVETNPVITAAEKTAYDGAVTAIGTKQDTLVAGSGITISGNVISADGGGGATYSAGTNISIDTANTINCTLPITSPYTNSIRIGTGTGSFYGENSIAMGAGINMNYGNTVGFGNTLNLAARLSYAFGHNLTTSNEAQLSCGFYNKSNKNSNTKGDSGNTLFSVGNGYYHYPTEGYHNALEIRQNGDIYFADTDNTTYQNYYEKPMVRLQDTISATTANTSALGGLKLVKLTQSEYDALVTKDPDTLYIITNVVNNS